MDKKVGQWASGSDICWRFLCCGILQERYLAKSERITVPNEAPCGRCGTYWAMPALRPPERVCRNADYGKIAGGRVEDSPRGAALIVGPSLTEKSEVRSGHAVDGQPFPDTFSDVQRLIRGECVELCAMLLKKNAAYGNSALDPLRLFSKASPQEQLRVRIDDKLSRLRSAQVDTEDMVSDLLGYLILLRVSGKLQANK